MRHEVVQMEYSQFTTTTTATTTTTSSTLTTSTTTTKTHPADLSGPLDTIVMPSDASTIASLSSSSSPSETKGDDVLATTKKTLVQTVSDEHNIPIFHQVLGSSSFSHPSTWSPFRIIPDPLSSSSSSVDDTQERGTDQKVSPLFQQNDKANNNNEDEDEDEDDLTASDSSSSSSSDTDTETEEEVERRFPRYRPPLVSSGSGARLGFVSTATSGDDRSSSNFGSVTPPSDRFLSPLLDDSSPLPSPKAFISEGAPLSRSGSNEVFEVEMILAKALIGGHRKFLIKWQDYSMSECTWENEGNILSKYLIAKFDKSKRLCLCVKTMRGVIPYLRAKAAKRDAKVERKKEKLEKEKRKKEEEKLREKEVGQKKYKKKDKKEKKEKKMSKKMLLLSSSDSSFSPKASKKYHSKRNGKASSLGISLSNSGLNVSGGGGGVGAGGKSAKRSKRPTVDSYNIDEYSFDHSFSPRLKKAWEEKQLQQAQESKQVSFEIPLPTFRVIENYEEEFDEIERKRKALSRSESPTISSRSLRSHSTSPLSSSVSPSSSSSSSAPSSLSLSPSCSSHLAVTEGKGSRKVTDPICVDIDDDLEDQEDDGESSGEDTSDEAYEAMHTRTLKQVEAQVLAGLLPFRKRKKADPPKSSFTDFDVDSLIEVQSHDLSSSFSTPSPSPSSSTHSLSLSTSLSTSLTSPTSPTPSPLSAHSLLAKSLFSSPSSSSSSSSSSSCATSPSAPSSSLLSPTPLPDS